MNNINTPNTCPHCDQHSKALQCLLKETTNFRVVCDSYSIVEGHILIIPKEHIPCTGAYTEQLFAEFELLYQEVKNFLTKIYGKMSAFEHGIIGQTVSHSHTHLLPVNLAKEDIVPEGKQHLTHIPNLETIREVYNNSKKYLLLEIQNELWTVDTGLSQPRFFRDRFASALGKPEYGDWKKMSVNPDIIGKCTAANKSCQSKWKNYFL